MNQQHSPTAVLHPSINVLTANTITYLIAKITELNIGIKG